MIAITEMIGKRPPVFKREVIFFANILSLFYGNDEETQVLRDEVGALETYGGRLISLINLLYEGPRNVLILEHPPGKALLDYFRDELKISLPEVRIVAHKVYTDIAGGEKNYSKVVHDFLAELRRDSAGWLNGYVTDEILVRMAGLVGKKMMSSLSGSKRGNNKLLLHEYLVSEGLLVFDTFLAEGPGDVLKGLGQLSAQGYRRAVVKSQIGASGIGMRKFDLDASPDKFEVPEYLFYEGPCLVQGWLDESFDGVRYVGSPSVQMMVFDDSIALHEVTEQILSKDSIHEGNISPPPCLAGDGPSQKELLRQAGIVGRWLHVQGYRGTASVDFQVVDRREKREIRVCELNARVTGATYPSLLARRFLSGGAWLMRNIRFSPALQDAAILNVLKKENLLFLPGRKEGVLPINFNPGERGRIVKAQFLFVGESVNDTFRLLKKTGEVKSMQGDYDRD